MRRAIKRVVLHLLQALGLFALARHRTRDRLRILCYHGGSIADEHRFMAGLFMRAETFRRRLRILAQGRYPVLGLGEAVDRLAAGTLPPGATVITIDDGFYSTFRDMPGPLREFGFPATVYVTSYHAAKGTPIFRLVVQYMFWKTAAAELDLAGLGPGLSGRHRLGSPDDRGRVCWQIIDAVEPTLDDPQRCEVARELGCRLGIDYGEIVADRRFTIATAEEIRAMVQAGIDVQLHTHRHRFPVDRAAAEREIADNRAYLEPLVGRPLDHFCYPSGQWAPEHGAWLEAVGVRSATTCDAGLNDRSTPRYELKRFLDGDDVSAIEFAAELAGVNEYLREARSRLGQLLGRRSRDRG